ncbi:MAG: hypothetical protein JNL72_01505 [Flavipsychrobacter sp.]|nr:hypothetical protein [Flavipsychrobacter sp.]
MNNSQTVLMVPLNSTYKVNTGGTNYMQSDASLCPKVCDIAGTSEASQVPGGQVSSMVNSCIDCREYESANAVVVHTPTLTNLQNAGFTRVRIYNGMDGSGKRYVVYVPIDERGQEVATDNMFVGDNTCVLTNCKYP